MVNRLAARRGIFDRVLETSAIAMRPAPPSTRLILRARPTAIAAASGAFGVALPQEPCRAAVISPRAALWLGPDEWLLLAEEERGGATMHGALRLALRELPHSLVDVSHRNVALELSGANTAAVLNSGCPLDLDLSSFPVNMCTRTLLGKAEIILWRKSKLNFRIESWRSFGAYVWRFLEEAAREFEYGTA